MNGSTLISIIAALAAIASCVDAADNKSAEFVATKEWQVVSEGQSIPQGLHVRINLQTGLKEAKLLDESERGTATALQNDAEGNNNAASLALDYEPNIIEESVRKAKEKRSYAELRKAYKEFQKNFRTDGEIIQQLLGQYRNYSKSPVESELKSKLNTLENLEYLVHQIDNAMIFIDSGGLDDVLLPIVVNDTTSTSLRVSAMHVLGALTGNNPKAQIKVFERNFGSHLAQILITATNRAELSAALHAFGTLLRKFPLAQQRILSTSGMQALIGLVRSVDVELRTKAKAITLISDLVLEKRLLLEDKHNAQDDATVAQYVLLEFDPWLQTHGYCSALDTVLSTNYPHLVEQAELVEQFAVSLETTKELCQPIWSQSAPLRHALLTLKNRFAHSEDEYKIEVSQTLNQICESFFEKRKTRTEL